MIETPLTCNRSRARFLVETLTNVKNNKLRSTSGAELGIEAADRMKKFLSSLGHHRRRAFLVASLFQDV